MPFADELAALIAKHDDATVETIVGMLVELEQQRDLLTDRKNEIEDDS